MIHPHFVESERSDLNDIETHRQIAGLQRSKAEPVCFQRIVARNGRARQPPAEHADQNEMLAQTSGLVLVECFNRCNHAQGLSIDACFFKQFTFGRREDRFAEVDLAARKAPSSRVRLVGAANEKDSVILHNKSDRC